MTSNSLIALISILGITLFSFFLMAHTYGVSGEWSDKEFEIAVEEWAIFSCNKYHIMSDSILVEYNSPTYSGGSTFYSQKLTKEERRSIIKVLQSMLLDSRHSEEINPTSDGDREYFWSVEFENSKSTFHVCKTHVESLLELTLVINQILPSQYHLQYDEEYILR